MSTRTRRVLIGAGLGALPGVLVIGGAVAVELWVESGGGLFGIIGVPLAIVGIVVGAVLGAANPETLRNPQLGALLGAIPGLLGVFVLGVFGIPFAVIGGWIGYRLALRAQRRALDRQPSNRRSEDTSTSLRT